MGIAMSPGYNAFPWKTARTPRKSNQRRPASGRSHLERNGGIADIFTATLIIGTGLTKRNVLRTSHDSGSTKGLQAYEKCRHVSCGVASVTGDRHINRSSAGVCAEESSHPREHVGVRYLTAKKFFAVLGSRSFTRSSC